jgi:hypothetical protein
MTDTASVFNGKTAIEHAAAAAEAIRAINHLTRHASALPYPCDAYAVLGRLAWMASMLPQACQQITQRLEKLDDDGLIGIDPGTHYAGQPALAVATCAEHLEADALPAAAQLHTALEAAQLAIAYAHYTGPDGNDEAEAAGAS